MVLVGFRRGEHIYSTGWLDASHPIVQAARDGHESFIILIDIEER